MEYKLYNVMEERVTRAIDDTLPQLGGCTCARCRADVAAYTLSRIQPHYISVPKDEPFTVPANIGEEYQTEILQIIVQAAEIVSSKPNHE